MWKPSSIYHSNYYYHSWRNTKYILKYCTGLTSQTPRIFLRGTFSPSWKRLLSHSYPTCRKYLHTCTLVLSQQLQLKVLPPSIFENLNLPLLNLFSRFIILHDLIASLHARGSLHWILVSSKWFFLWQDGEYFLLIYQQDVSINNSGVWEMFITRQLGRIYVKCG